MLDRAACIMHLFVCEITVSQLCLGSTRSIALIVLQAMKEAETFNTVSYEQLQTIISDLALAYRLTQGSVLLQVLRTWHARGNLGAGNHFGGRLRGKSQRQKALAPGVRSSGPGRADRLHRSPTPALRKPRLLLYPRFLRCGCKD